MYPCWSHNCLATVEQCQAQGSARDLIADPLSPRSLPTCPCMQTFMPKFVEKALDRVLNSVKEKETTALFELLLFLHQEGAISSTDLISGLATYTVQLEDLRCRMMLGSLTVCSQVCCLFTITWDGQILMSEQRTASSLQPVMLACLFQQVPGGSSQSFREALSCISRLHSWHLCVTRPHTINATGGQAQLL